MKTFKVYAHLASLRKAEALARGENPGGKINSVEQSGKGQKNIKLYSLTKLDYIIRN